MTQFNKQELVYSGKVKSMYKTTSPEFLIAEFRDDTTAFDGAKHEKLVKKGIINNQINARLMDMLNSAGVPTHFERIVAPNESLVKHLTMIPIECVVRNLAAGSLSRRLGIPKGQRLDPPLYELFFKNDELHDPLINENHVLSFGWATQPQLDRMKWLSSKINNLLSSFFAESGLVLVDSKYEFGVTPQGTVTLGDEISPDSCRIWDLETQKILDKDRFRHNMGEVIESYAEIAARLGVQLQSY
jgi:phosphoribosylaminoimidazole-succinocarboxamide synthase